MPFQNLVIYLTLITAHFFEHVVQMLQLYILHWPRAQCLGLLGLKYPMLVHNELLHFTFAVITLLGLFLFKPVSAQAYRWWNNTINVSIFHLGEHSLLLYQYITKNYLFGGTTPTAIGQIWFPRLELHFFYNLIISVFLTIFIYYQTKKRITN